ncbi:transmembrane amino acid transporter protein-domain-containing protein [Syncephalis plumigaleata]|nr:transmembrane amino acid transporter protein-domain-containing protein [Syncephalis plumigaleata]
MAYKSAELDISNATTSQHSSAPLITEDIRPSHYAMSMGDDDHDNDDNDESNSYPNRSSTINLANTILGAGMLAMPSAIAATGLVFGSVLILFSACCSGFGLYLLSRCAAIIRSRDASFYRVAQHTYPQAATIIDLAIAVKCFGVGVSYLIIIGDLMPEVMSALLNGDASGNLTSSWLTSRALWITIFMVTIVAPLSFLRRLDSLRHTSMAALVAVAYLFILVVGSYVSPSAIPPRADLPPRPHPAIFYKVPIFVFAFTCHQNIFSIYNELVDNSQRYFIGLTGYLSFGDRVLPNLIVTCGRAALVILQVFSFPLQCHPCRASLNKVIPHRIAYEDEAAQPALLPSSNNTNDHDQQDAETDSHSSDNEDEAKKTRSNAGHTSNRRYYILTSCILLASYILAISVTKLDLVLSLVGATGSTTISFILPGLYNNNKTHASSYLRWMAGALAVYGICVLCICVSFTLKKAIYH